MGQRDAVAAAVLGHDQFQRIGHEFDRLRPMPGVEHGGVPDQRGDGARAVEVEGFVAIPACRFLADRAQCRAVLWRQIVEPRVLFVQPLHRHRPTVGPAVAALGRLLGYRDVLRCRIEEPDQAFGLSRRFAGIGFRFRRQKESIQAFQRPFPGLADLDQFGEGDDPNTVGTRAVSASQVL